MLEKLEKIIDSYHYVYNKASQKCAELKHKKDTPERNYWAGVMNTCSLILKDLKEYRTYLESVQQDLGDGLDFLRGK